MVDLGQRVRPANPNEHEICVEHCVFNLFQYQVQQGYSDKGNAENGKYFVSKSFFKQFSIDADHVNDEKGIKDY